MLAFCVLVKVDISVAATSVCETSVRRHDLRIFEDLSSIYNLDALYFFSFVCPMCSVKRNVDSCGGVP